MNVLISCTKKNIRINDKQRTKKGKGRVQRDMDLRNRRADPGDGVENDEGRCPKRAVATGATVIPLVYT